MPDLVLTGLPEAMLVFLEGRAAEHRSTPAEEAKSILAEAIGSRSSAGWDAVDAIHRHLAASGRSYGDSAELLREDRDR
jgi:plasmid stability protein